MNSQFQIPVFSGSPIYWPDGVECNFSQLPAVIAAAERDGFEAVRMTVIKGGYELQFMPEKIKGIFFLRVGSKVIKHSSRFTRGKNI